MKFWQLLSIVGEELITEKSSLDPSWNQYGVWVRNLPEIVGVQDREKLDAPMQKDFVVSVLGAAERFCYLGEDGQLRSWLFAPADRKISFLDVFEKFGENVLEDVCEKGSARV